MSLYPSLEDMKVDRMMQQQHVASQQIYQQQQALGGVPPYAANPYAPTNELSGFGATQQLDQTVINKELYPDLFDFMGMELSKEIIAANMPEYLQGRNTIATLAETTVATPYTGMVAPLSGNTVGLRTQVTNGVRELILCKGGDKKVGLRVQSIDKGVFVCMVVKGSPAALGGLRFGDQILQINGQLVAGYSVDDVHKLLKKSPKDNISVVVRDRPFERSITLHKDSRGSLGFQFNSGQITAIVKDSSAARNGLLIDHYLLEIDGQNVVGMKDKEITAVINSAPQIVTLTIIPKFIYDHMMKKLSSSWIRSTMDHSKADF